MQSIIRQVESSQIKSDSLKFFNVGDTIKVFAKIIEGTKERIQAFEGTVIKFQNGGINESFTVRRVSYGVGVEKTWKLNSPKLEKIILIRKGHVRRAKLYYLRKRVGKAAKIREIITSKSSSNLNSNSLEQTQDSNQEQVN